MDTTGLQGLCHRSRDGVDFVVGKPEDKEDELNLEHPKLNALRGTRSRLGHIDPKAKGLEPSHDLASQPKGRRDQS